MTVSKHCRVLYAALWLLAVVTLPPGEAEERQQQAEPQRQQQGTASSRQAGKKDEYKVFVPTKKVDADASIAFPADI